MEMVKLARYSPNGALEGKVTHYKFERVLPSHGIGLWVEFPEDEESKGIFEAKGGVEYALELNKSMKKLGERDDVYFMGQTVGYKGSPMFNSLEGVVADKRLELPVMEEVQMGMATGMAMNGYTPVTIFPRIDFLTLATNQLVNHLDKMEELSAGQYKPRVIVRTAVGNPKPLYPGPQHCQDHTEAYRMMLPNMDVVKLEHSSEIGPAYDRAIDSDRSTLLVEI